jgi:hypothetical protein
MRRVVSTFLVYGLQTLAVAAPRSRERDNCIMILVLSRIQVGNVIHEWAPSYLQEQHRQMCGYQGRPSQEGGEA